MTLDYYPFGLQQKGYNNIVSPNGNALAQKYKTYQGQEISEELGYDMLEFKYRHYDAAIGRFVAVDPLAMDYVYNSPYAFQENKLGMGIELEGLELFNLTQYAEDNNSSAWTKRIAGAVDVIGNNMNVGTILFNKVDAIASSIDNVGNGTANVGDIIQAASPASGLSLLVDQVQGPINMAETTVAAANGDPAAQGAMAGSALMLLAPGPEILKVEGNKLPNSANVVRGGLNTADNFANGSGVTINKAGNLNGVSVNSAKGASVETLSKGVRNGQIGTTTVGSIRKAGGNVIKSPTKNNPNHSTLSGIPPAVASELFNPTIPNPMKN